MPNASDPYLLTAVAPGKSHLPTLDGLRAVSISLVIGQHFISTLPGAPPIPGHFGVEIFFAISGFLITRLLLAEIIDTSGVSLANFYFRRALRLMPALAAMVLVVTALMIAQGARDLRASACALLYVTNYCVTEVGVMYDGPGVTLEGTWSLAVEEHFYLVFPLLLAGLYRRDIRALYAAVAGICVAALAFRIGYALADRPGFFLYWRSETAVDLLMSGCVLSIMSAHEAGRSALRKMATTAFLALASVALVAGQIASGAGKLGAALGQSAVAFWLAALLVSLMLNPELAAIRHFLNRPAVAWLGRVSYSLYLWHVVIAMIEASYGFFPGYAGAALAIACSLALAATSDRFVEQPLLARRATWARRLGIGGVRARTGATPAL